MGISIRRRRDTGAIAQKVGRSELAHKGTLFLDEIGDIPPELQAKLLRVLQEQEFERLGSTRTHKVDARLFADTHRELPEMVKHSTFREDLLYRVERISDQRSTTAPTHGGHSETGWHFTELHTRRMNKRIEEIPPETMDALV